MQRGDLVEVAGGQHVQRLLVADAGFVVRQEVREVGRLDDERPLAREGREDIGHRVPVAALAAHGGGDRQHRHVGKQRAHEGQQRLEAVIAAKQAGGAVDEAGRRLDQRGCRGAVGRNGAEDRLDIAQRGGEGLAGATEMIGEDEQDALVACPGGGLQAFGDEMRREQVMRNGDAGERHRRRRDRVGRPERLAKQRFVRIDRGKGGAFARAILGQGGDGQEQRHENRAQSARRTSGEGHGFATTKLSTFEM